MKRDFEITGLNKIKVQLITSSGNPDYWELWLDGIEQSDKVQKQVGLLLDGYLTFSIQLQGNGNFLVQTVSNTSSPGNAATSGIVKADSQDVAYYFGTTGTGTVKVQVVVDEIVLQMSGQHHKYVLEEQELTLQIKPLTAAVFEHKFWTNKI